MPNVYFKRGTQASLNTLINGNGNRFVEGSFYLTSDTNRLYFAQSATNLVDLNQYIHITTGVNPASPPSSATQGYSNLQQGDIYYWSDQNILAICDNPATGAWTQLNPDTALKANASNITVTSTTANKIDFALEVEDTKNTKSQGAFSIQGSANVTVTANNGVITIESVDTTDNALYTLGTESSTNTGAITLNASGQGGTASSIAIAGDGSVTVSSDANGNITISGAGGVSTASQAFDASGNYTISLGTTDGTITTQGVQPIISYGTANAATAAFENGVAALDVYTKAEVSGLISAAEAAANAMTYKGTVSSTTHSAIASTANVGDTYKAEDGFTIDGIGTVKAGDLLIAKGDEDGDVTWDIVPSGDDQTITGSVTANSASISDQSGVLAGITVDGSSGNYGTISVTSSISGKQNTLTVAHGAAGPGTAVTIATATSATTQDYDTNAEITIPVITSISKDSAGHITDISGANYVLTDSHANIKSVGITSSSTTVNSASVVVTVADTDDVSKNATLNLKSDTLEMTATSASNVYEITTNLVWGSF